MTASFKASFAPSKPATSDHFTQGFSITMAPSSLACNFFFSGSSESLSLSLFLSSLLKKEQQSCQEQKGTRFPWQKHEQDLLLSVDQEEQCYVTINQTGEIMRIFRETIELE